MDSDRVITLGHLTSFLEWEKETDDWLTEWMNSTVTIIIINQFRHDNAQLLFRIMLANALSPNDSSFGIWWKSEGFIKNNWLY